MSQTRKAASYIRSLKEFAASSSDSHNSKSLLHSRAYNDDNRRPTKKECSRVVESATWDPSRRTNENSSAQTTPGFASAATLAPKNLLTSFKSPVQSQLKQDSARSESQNENLDKDKYKQYVESLIIPEGQLTIVEEDIGGLEELKYLIKSRVINPIKLPELHQGLYRAPNGVLLFGPPGTGKTLIAKWVAGVSKVAFFEITPSCIGSKFHGESENLVSAIFQVARKRAPSILFIDEVDGLLGKRKDNNDEVSLRIKNQFLAMMDGLTSPAGKTVIIFGATNRPDALDEAVLRRFSKRIFVPLPDKVSRKEQLKRVIEFHYRSLDPENSECGTPSASETLLEYVASQTERWSGSDLRNLCCKAAEHVYDDAVRRFGDIQRVPMSEFIRNFDVNDFAWALQRVKPASDYEEKPIEMWRQFSST